MSFGERCRKYRTERHMTQTMTAKQAGISRRTYLYYESGQKMPRTRDTIQKLADCFGVDINQLIVEDETIWQQTNRQRPLLERTAYLLDEIAYLLSEETTEVSSTDREEKRLFVQAVTDLCHRYAATHPNEFPADELPEDAPSANDAEETGEFPPPDASP